MKKPNRAQRRKTELQKGVDALVRRRASEARADERERWTKYVHPPKDSDDSYPPRRIVDLW